MNSDNTVKILITADLHLGRQDEAGIITETVRVDTLRNIISAAKEHDMLLIAGDFIDSGDISAEAKAALAESFKELAEAGVKVFYASGIGEQNRYGGVHSFIADLTVEHLFAIKDIEICPVEIKGRQFQIYGAAYSSDFNLPDVKRKEAEGFHIGLFHCGFDFITNRSELQSLALDFYAIGFDHTSKIFKIYNRVLGAMPGSPIAFTEDETGDRFVLSMSVEEGKVSDIKRLKANSVQIVNLGVNCALGGNNLKSLLAEKSSDKTALKLSLHGERDFSTEEFIDSVKDNFFCLHVEDESVPSVNFLTNTFAGEDSIRGQFFRILKDKTQSGSIPSEISTLLPNALQLIMADDTAALEKWLCSL